nr:MAG TPA: hypothetical protein [Bacteriophage sp.]
MAKTKSRCKNMEKLWFSRKILLYLQCLNSIKSNI